MIGPYIFPLLFVVLVIILHYRKSYPKPISLVHILIHYPVYYYAICFILMMFMFYLNTAGLKSLAWLIASPFIVLDILLTWLIIFPRPKKK